MIETLIVGSGFSAFCSYILLKRYKPKILNCSKLNNFNNLFIKRNNLNINKFFSKKNISIGNFRYNFNSNIKIHDRLTSGGNSNIWGGFIDISNLSDKFIKECNQDSIKFEKLNFDINGYDSNNKSIRQIRDKDNNILDSRSFIKNCIYGFLYSFEIKKDKIILKIINEENGKFDYLETKKLILAINFPQLIDLMYRSSLIHGKKIISLSEFDHKFIMSFKKNYNNYKTSDCVIKFDFLRSIKHYLGYQKSLDMIKIPIPIYIDQVFSNNNNNLKINLDCNLKTISSAENKIKFGNSIHYCNLCLDNVHIDHYLSKISNNVIGVGMPFVNQKKTGPISNDIVNRIIEKVS